MFSSTMSANTISPILAEAVALQPEFFQSLIVPSPSILLANTRNFAVTVKLEGALVKSSFTLLGASGVTAAAAGYLSAKLVGPLDVEVSGLFGATSSPGASVVAVLLRPSTWAQADTIGKAQSVADSVLLSLSQMNTVAQGQLPIAAKFKNNVHVTQSAGLDAVVDIVGTVTGFAAVYCTIRGKLLLEGVTDLQPY